MRANPLLLTLLLTLAICVVAVERAGAVVVGSFESPVIIDPPLETPFFPVMTYFGWQETGPVTDQQGFIGKLDTGVFYNFAFVPNPSNPSEFIPNPEFVIGADGDQIGFIGSIPEPVAGQELVSTYRILDTVAYTEGASYRLLLGVGKSGRQPPNDAATLAVEFIYDDNGSITTVGSPLVIAATDVTANVLSPFFLDLGPIGSSDPYLNANLGVRVRALTGTEGNWIFDDVRVVPEPAAALLFAGSALTLLSCRRRYP